MTDDLSIKTLRVKAQLDQARELLYAIENELTSEQSDLVERELRLQHFFKYYAYLQSLNDIGLEQIDRNDIQMFLEVYGLGGAMCWNPQPWTCKLCGTQKGFAEAPYECVGICRNCVWVLSSLDDWSHGGEPRFLRDPGELLSKQPIPRSLREKIHLRDGGKCLACGKTENLSVDHIIPEAKGGTMDEDNLQTLCLTCNCRKRTKTIDYRRKGEAA